MKWMIIVDQLPMHMSRRKMCLNSTVGISYEVVLKTKHYVIFAQFIFIPASHVILIWTSMMLVIYSQVAFFSNIQSEESDFVNLVFWSAGEKVVSKNG